MKAIASSLIILAAALFWQSSVAMSDHNSLKYFGILIVLVLIYMGLAGFWRSFSPEERDR